MLRLWRESLVVFLSPTEVCWLKFAASYKSKVRAKRTVEADAAYGVEPWQGAVAALRSEAEAWRREALAVTIVLSNHFVRYVPVPANDNVSGTEEEQALARFHFGKVHGERSRNWDVRLSDTRPGAPKIACAIDAGLLEALRACFPRDGRPRLVSMQPLLMSAVNRWRRQVPSTGAWFLVVEPERACLALHSGQDWLAIQNTKGQYSEADACETLLDREQWRANIAHVPDTVLIHAPRLVSPPPPRHGAWKLLGLQVTWPEGLSPLEDSIYAPALTAS